MEQEGQTISNALIIISSKGPRQDEKVYHGRDWLQKAYDIVRQSWIMDCFKMYPIATKVTQFIEKTMKNWIVQRLKEEKTLTKVKIQGDIFYGDVLLQLLFVRAMMPFNHIYRKYIGGNKFHKAQ